MAEVTDEDREAAHSRYPNLEQWAGSGWSETILRTWAEGHAVQREQREVDERAANVWHRKRRAQIERLEAEAERLREALRELTAGNHPLLSDTKGFGEPIVGLPEGVQAAPGPSVGIAKIGGEPDRAVVIQKAWIETIKRGGSVTFWVPMDDLMLDFVVTKRTSDDD